MIRVVLCTILLGAQYLILSLSFLKTLAIFDLSFFSPKFLLIFKSTIIGRIIGRFLVVTYF
jgi:hypothetical protein